MNEGINTYLLTSAGTTLNGNVTEWMENWWIAVLFARLGSVFVGNVTDQSKKWAVKLGWRRGGQRS
jgi:hypothetical protein